MKIVINSCYGGFNLSNQALQLYKERENVPEHIPLTAWNIPRNDETLVAIVEELDQQSWGQFSALKVVEIPDDVEWEISDYDGDEWVAEKHRKWN